MSGNKAAEAKSPGKQTSHRRLSRGALEETIRIRVAPSVVTAIAIGIYS